MTALRPQPSPRALLWPDIMEALRDRLPDLDHTVYIVGGTVRDAYLQRDCRDIDLATATNGCDVARRIADRLDGAYYPLDKSRGVGRAIVPWNGSDISIDVAQFRGSTLHDDLTLRDFTLNAMAVDLLGDLQAIIDPLDGLGDLQRRLLRRCGPQSIEDDPVRALRGVRVSVEFNLRIDSATQADMRLHASDLSRISAERIRDEFIQLQASKAPTRSIKIASQLGLLRQIIPELERLKNLPQDAPHVFDVWTHTLATHRALSDMLAIFSGSQNDNLTANFQLGTVVFTFGELRPHLAATLAHTWANGRPHRALLLLAALLHDVGKPDAQSLSPAGQKRFLEHEVIGAQITESCSQRLKLSNDEARRLTVIVRHHMRPLWLFNGINTPQGLSRRAIHRFWRDTGPAGVDVCLLSLADFLATYGNMLDTHHWLRFLEIIRTLLNAFFFERATFVEPDPLLSGQDLLTHFDLTAGPLIGRILEKLLEAQAAGEVTSREQAFALAKDLLAEQ